MLFLKTYTTFTKASSSTIEKCEYKILRPFHAPEIFKAVRVKEDTLWEKSVKHIFLKNEVLVFSSSYLWLTFEMKYLHENFENNSKWKLH